jgi:mxaD protein
MRSPSCFTPGLVTRVIGTCLVSACLMSSAFAHGPTPKKIDETVTIAAAPDVVWKKLADFGAISTWHPDISASQADKGNAVGSVRALSFKGGKITESLDEYDTANRSYSYRMDQENVDALPVSSYSATIVVKPAGQGSEVSWSGRFYRGDTNNEPPENLNDEAAIKAMDAFFKHGLAGLKNVSEGKAK